MATRMYMYTDSTFSPSPSSWTPSVLGPWSSDFTIYYPLHVDGGFSDDAAYSLRTINTAAVASEYVHNTGISPPMPAGVTFTAGSTTWRYVNRAREESASHNAFIAFCVAILQNDGTLIDVSSLVKDGTEMAVSATTYTGRDIAATTISGLATYTTLGGERLQIETGWDKDGTASGIIADSMGKNGAVDLSGDGDTGTDNPFIECSETWTFDAEGTVYGDHRLMMMGCGR